MRTSALVTTFGALLLFSACSNQQQIHSLQKQIDQLAGKNLELTQTVQDLDGELKELKTLSTQMGNTILAQKQAIEILSRGSRSMSAAKPASIRVSRAAPVRSGAASAKAKKPGKARRSPR